MKNLANCTPREFLTQTVKIRHAVEKWLKVTDVMAIRKRMPNLPEDMPKEERAKAISEQARANVGAMIDALADEHPDETVELLALLCFVEPDDVNNHKMSEYLGAIADMLGDEDVWSFFTSFQRLGQRVGLME